MLELTLMVDACSVPTILRFRLIWELAKLPHAVEDKFLKEMVLAENVWSTPDQMQNTEIASATNVMIIREWTEKECVKYVQQVTNFQLTRDSARKKQGGQIHQSCQLQLLEDSRMFLWLVSVHLIDFWIRMIRLMKSLWELAVLMHFQHIKAKLMTSTCQLIVSIRSLATMVWCQIQMQYARKINSFDVEEGNHMSLNFLIT